MMLLIAALALAQTTGADPIRAVTTSVPRNLTAFPQGGRHQISYTMSPVVARTAWTLTNWEGQTVSTGQGGGGTVTMPVDTARLKLGPYVLNLVLQDAGGREISRRETYLGVITRSPMPKARPGEFLFGLDVQYGDPAPDSILWSWMDLMGVDIVRGGIGGEDDADYTSKRMRLYRERGIQSMIKVDPPTAQNPAERERILQNRIRVIERIAKEQPDIKYWEMGNEPDLFGFYPGKVENYVADYIRMYDAVKRNNPNTVVMNGGLSYAGEEGRVRSRRIVEIMPKDKLDAWAYHGHGPGVGAERNAYNRIRRDALEFGSADRPFIETESGVAAVTKQQETVQARTVVQKMTFGQSIGMPFFHWFRLLMFEEDYGNLKNREGTEPRPAVLAYRNMVEQLRHHQWTKTLDFGREGLEGYSFREKGSGSRALVLWSNLPLKQEVSLILGTSKAKVRDARIVDLWGNSKPLTVTVDGTARVTVGESPFYVKWSSAEPSFEAGPAPAIIVAPPVLDLVEGVENTLAVRVKNPTNRVLEGHVAIRVTSGSLVAVNQAGQVVRIRPKRETTVRFNLEPKAVVPTYKWPTTWRAFVDADPVKSGIEKLTSLPATLPGSNGDVRGETVALGPDGRIDLTRIGATIAEKRATILLAEIESERDQKVRIGAGADWWMAWYVNGRPVYDTMEKGNGPGFTFADHVFEVPLRKGKNLLAVVQYSGSQGRQIVIGSPEQVARVARARSGGESASIVLTEKGQGFAKERLELRLESPTPGMGTLTPTSSVAEWQQTPVTGILENGTGLQNFFEKEPDASRWWKGNADFSARYLLRQSEGRVFFLVAVQDDRVTDGDRVEIALKPPSGGKATLFVAKRLARDEAKRITLFVLERPASSIPQPTFLYQVQATDDDGYGRKQTVTSAWHRTSLGRAQ